MPAASHPPTGIRRLLGGFDSHPPPLSLPLPVTQDSSSDPANTPGTRPLRYERIPVRLFTSSLVIALVLAGAPAGSSGYKRVDFAAYVGSATPTASGGFNCQVQTPTDRGIGCVRLDPLPGERYVSGEIKDAIGPDVSAWLVQVHRDEEGVGDDWVFHRFCTKTKRSIKILPETNVIYVVMWQGTCPGRTARPALATTGEVTLTFTRSR